MNIAPMLRDRLDLARRFSREKPLDKIINVEVSHRVMEYSNTTRASSSKTHA